MCGASRRLGGGFHRLWAASAAGNLGDAFHRIAVALLAARITTDPLAFSLLTALGFLPWLVLGLPSGALVDRYDRRRLAVFAGSVRVSAVAVLLMAVTLDRASLWLLYVVVLVVGTCETVYDNSLMSMVPTVVRDPENLERANGRLHGAELLMQSFLGPPLASVLFALLASAAFGVNVACYVLAVMLLLALPGRYRASGGEGSAPMLSAMGEGIRYVIRDPMHRTLLSVVVVLGFSNAMTTALAVLWARVVLGVPEAAYGFFTLTLAGGALVGSQTAALVAARAGRGRTMGLATITTALALLLVGVTRSPYVAGLAWAVSGWGIMVWNVIYGSLRLRLTPDALLGRMIGIYRLVAWGIMPIGAIAGGVLGGIGGLRLPWLVAGAVTFAGGVYAVFVLSNSRVNRAIKNS